MLDIVRDESGQGMVEYGLLLGFIALAAVLAVTALGPSVRKLFEDAETKLPGGAVGGGEG